MTRSDGRGAADLRPVSIEPGFIDSAHGSVLFSIGKTRLVCTAMIEESVPGWMRGRGSGWVTSEYGMLPGSTSERKSRDAARGKQDGRTVEIQRLIGRSLRSVVDFKALGERTVWIDCDVIQADGGTRCAAIMRRLRRAAAGADRAGRRRPRERAAADRLGGGGIRRHRRRGADARPGLRGGLACGRRHERRHLRHGRLVEVQATAERTPFGRASLDELLGLAAGGIEQIAELQTRVLHEARSGVA